MEPTLETSPKAPFVHKRSTKVMLIILLLGVAAELWLGGQAYGRSRWEPRYTRLNADYTELNANYIEMRSAVNARQPNGEAKEAFVTPDDTAVGATVSVLTGGFSQDNNERWADYWTMYQWVVDNIKYSSDSPLPLLPSSPSISGLSWKDEYWRMPSETLEDETGDCEDMATLLASMWMNYSSGRNSMLVIEWTSDKKAHVAVAFPVAGGNLTILDPAGKYYTGKPASLFYKAVSIAVNEWLAQWPGETSIHVSCVFYDTFYKAFATTDEFVQWVLARWGTT